MKNTEFNYQQSSFNPETINLISSLAMPVHQGAILVSGYKCDSLIKQLSNSIDISTKILYNINSFDLTESDVSSALALANNDIRVAVHRQEMAEFLEDVQHNMFNVIVLAADTVNEELIALAKTMLTPNGYIIIDSKQPIVSNDSNWLVTHIGSMAILTAIMLVKQQRSGRGRKRRADKE